MLTEQILALLMQEREKLNRAIEALQGAKRRGRPPKSPLALVETAAAAPEKKRRGRTAAQRKAQAHKMKEYWAKRKKEAAN